MGVKSDNFWDAILVALRPQQEPVLSDQDLTEIANHDPGVVVAQFWGDLDRAALSAANLSFWPPGTPSPGQMDIFSAVGPEPVIRLQTSGLKVSEVLWRSRLTGVSPTMAELEAEQSGWGQRVAI